VLETWAVSTLCGLLSPYYAENLHMFIFMKLHIVLDLVYPKIRTREITIYHGVTNQHKTYEGWNFNSGNYLFTTDTK